MEFNEKLLNHPSIVKYRELFDGVQYFYTTDNGDSFSVISHLGSYGGISGLYELAPIVMNGEEFAIVGEPTGYLTADKVIQILEENSDEIQRRR